MATEKPKNKRLLSREKARKARKARGGKPGRPSLFTPDRVERLLQSLSIGAYRKTACQAAGISIECFQDWMTRGRAEIEEGANPEREVLNAEEVEADPESVLPKYAPCLTFAQLVRAVELSETDAEMRMLGVVATAAYADARHAQWFLERKFPEHWAARHRVSIGGDASAPPVTTKSEGSIEVKVPQGVILLPPQKDE